MNRRAIIFFAMLASFAFASLGCAAAQDNDDIQQGIKAYGTYRGGDIDTVSMTNGNLTLQIPLISYPQRGKLHLSFSLVYNHKNYHQKTICNVNGCTTLVFANSFSPFANGNAPLAVVPDQGFEGTEVEIDGNQGQFLFDSYSLATPDGASHQLAPLSSTDYETVDGTGLHAYFPSGTNGSVTDADGTKYGFASTSPVVNTQEDTNGNQITVPAGGGWLDTVGRTIPPIPSSLGSGGSGNCPSGPLPVNLAAQWVVPGPNGGSSTFVFCWVHVTADAIYNTTTETWGTSTFNYLQSVVLPNGTAWMFQYSNDGYADLTQVTFPTGGTISYGWSGINGCTGIPIPLRWLTSRTVNANDGTGNHTWNYSYGVGGGFTTTVSDPLGNNTVYTNTYESYCSAYTTAVQYYQGAVQSSNLLKTVSTNYSHTAGPFGGQGNTLYMNIVPTQITTTWKANGKTSQVTKAYDSGFTFKNPQNGNNTMYTGLYGKVITQKEYDYGTTSGQPGPLLKQTNTSYAWRASNPNYSAYLGNNMMNLVYSSQITDGTSQKAYTQYSYDETATIASGMGAAQNLDTSVWTGTLRGNQTSVNRWLNLPTVQTITNKTTYYDTGVPSVAKDPLLNPTTYF